MDDYYAYIIMAYTKSKSVVIQRYICTHWIVVWSLFSLFLRLITVEYESIAGEKSFEINAILILLFMNTHEFSEKITNKIMI